MAYGDAGYEDDLMELERLERDEPFYGDPRRCPHHPEVRTSSDDGMFDGPCWKCEDAMYDLTEDDGDPFPVPVAVPATPTVAASWADDKWVADDIEF